MREVIDMKTEYEAIMWFLVLIAPIIAFAIGGVMFGTDFTNIVIPEFRGDKGVSNGYAWAMIIVETFWCIGISCIMFNDPPQTKTIVKNNNGTI